MTSLTIDWYNTASDIPEQLWSQCFPPPLEGQWWYAALEQSKLENQFQFLYAVVRLEDKPIAIAPAFVMNVPISQVVPEWLLPLFLAIGKILPSLLYQRTLFIGSPCADEGTVGIIEGMDHYPVLTCIQQAMTDKAFELHCPMFAWKDFPKNYNDNLTRIARASGLFPMVSFPGTRVEIPDSDMQKYFTSLKASHRHTLKKKLRRSSENIMLSTEILQQPGSRVLDDVFALFRQTYDKATTKFEELNRDFFTQIAQCPQAYFIIMREPAGNIVAFMLCFAFPDTVINKFIGIDYQRPKEWFLYFRLWEAALHWAVLRKATSIQSGQTGYRPKLETGHKLVALTHYCRHSNLLINMIYKIFAKTISWLTLDKGLSIHIKAHPEMMNDYNKI